MRVVYFIRLLANFQLFLTVLFVLCTYDTHDSAAKPMSHQCIDIVVLPVDKILSAVFCMDPADNLP